jgi:hypothetical protein
MPSAGSRHNIIVVRAGYGPRDGDRPFRRGQQSWEGAGCPQDFPKVMVRKILGSALLEPDWFQRSSTGAGARLPPDAGETVGGSIGVPALASDRPPQHRRVRMRHVRAVRGRSFRNGVGGKGAGQDEGTVVLVRERFLGGVSKGGPESAFMSRKPWAVRMSRRPGSCRSPVRRPLPERRVRTARPGGGAEGRGGKLPVSVATGVLNCFGRTVPGPSPGRGT